MKADFTDSLTIIEHTKVKCNVKHLRNLTDIKIATSFMVCTGIL